MNPIFPVTNEGWYRTGDDDPCQQNAKPWWNKGKEEEEAPVD